MTKFSAKYFHSKTDIKAIIFTRDKRIKTIFENPENNTLTYNNKTYMLNDKDWFLSEGFPTYIFNDSDIDPQNPLNPKVKSVMNPDELNIAMSSKVAREILDASKSGMDGNVLTLVLSILSLIAVGGVGYLMVENFQSITITINEIREVLKLIGGQ
jgi:hypothetical protein